MLDLVQGLFSPKASAAEAPAVTMNSQTMPLLAAAIAADPTQNDGSDDILTIGGSAVYAETGPNGSILDLDGDTAGDIQGGTITTYTVQSGDTVASIAKTFGVSSNTILWANNLTRGAKLKVGSTIVVLPITGIKHVVAKGDTITKIAARYKADADEVSSYNGVESADLKVGDTIIVPDGELPAQPKKVESAKTKKGIIGRIVSTESAGDGYFRAPMASYVRTQGIHGHNGVDLSTRIGAPIFAAAAGTVIVAKDSGYNGGYGEMVVIAHDNGMQTLYGHLSSVLVSVGQTVAQGQTIGAEGNTGRSTGPHLHFEVRGGRNPF